MIVLSFFSRRNHHLLLRFRVWHRPIVSVNHGLSCFAEDALSNGFEVEINYAISRCSCRFKLSTCWDKGKRCCSKLAHGEQSYWQKDIEYTPVGYATAWRPFGLSRWCIEKSSNLEQLNAEETVFSLRDLVAISVVLPSCVSQYFRQHEAFEVADYTSQLSPFNF